jgi:PAS domain S-box-containing protein
MATGHDPEQSMETMIRALEAARVGTIELDLDRREFRACSIALGLAGLESAESHDLEHLLKRIHPEDRNSVSEALDTTAQSLARHAVEFRICEAGGPERWLMWRAEVKDHCLDGILMDITDRKAAEQSLRESESFYRQTLESVPGMTFTNDPDGSCTYVSEQWVQFTGIPAEEQFGDGWVQLIHPEDRERAFEQWQKAVAGEAPYDLEFRIRRHDGVYQWFKVRGRALRDGRGQTTKWLGTGVNIDDIKRTEEHLRESEERFRLLVEASSQAAWEANPVGLVTTDAPSWRQYTGQTLEEYLGDGWTNAVHPDDRAHALAAWKNAARSRSVYRHEFRLRRADGEWRWTSVVAAPIYSSTGELLKWVGMHTDITEKKLAETALRESESFYHQTLDGIPGMSFINARDGTCTYLSKQWAEFTGLPAEELLGDRWTKIIHPVDLQNLFSAWRETKKRGGQYSLEYRLRRWDGEYEWFQVRVRALVDSDGATTQWFGTAVSIEELKRTETALRETQKQLEDALSIKDQFLGLVSHELRTPLTLILGMSRILNRADERPEHVHEAATILKESAERLQVLVENMLILARVDKEGSADAIEPVHLGHLIEKVVTQHGTMHPARKLTVDMELEEPLVEGLAGWLEQVVQNFLRNAEKYAGPDAPIAVHVDGSESEIEVRVVDRGNGLSPEVAERAFEPFFRDPVSAGLVPGAGLGLTVCKRLIELQNGRIWAKPVEGGGAEFGFAVPRLRDE